MSARLCCCSYSLIKLFQLALFFQLKLMCGEVMRDMSMILDGWGAWAASDKSGHEWQHIAAGFKNLIPHGKNSRNPCNDDDGIIIDSCIARLKKLKPEGCELLIAHYVMGISLRSIARKMKCSDGTIRKELQTAEGFVCGCLSMIEWAGFNR